MKKIFPGGKAEHSLSPFWNISLFHFATAFFPLTLILPTLSPNCSFAVNLLLIFSCWKYNIAPGARHKQELPKKVTCQDKKGPTATEHGVLTTLSCHRAEAFRRSQQERSYSNQEEDDQWSPTRRSPETPPSTSKDSTYSIVWDRQIKTFCLSHLLSLTPLLPWPLAGSESIASKCKRK